MQVSPTQLYIVIYSDGFKDHNSKDQGKARTKWPRTMARQGTDLGSQRPKARQEVGGKAKTGRVDKDQGLYSNTLKADN
jgi:hypothetical protein